MGNEINILDHYSSPVTLQDKELISNCGKLSQFLKDVTLLKELFDKEIKDRFGEQPTIIDNYKVDFKSSNLFDKNLAKDYLKQYSEEEREEFYVSEIDYKKLQKHIKEETTTKEYRENYCKKGKSKIVIKRIEE